MAKKIDLLQEDNKKKIIEIAQRAIQSSNLNFLLGSGCSRPAIETLGNIEKEVTELRDKGNNDDAERKLFEFALPLIESSNKLQQKELEKKYLRTLAYYKDLLKSITSLLLERKGNVLPKQATIFTTNYDLFIEKAATETSKLFYLNDGFIRNTSLNKRYEYSTSEFFVSRRKRGFHFDYEVEIPTINLMKLHGSLNWKSENNNIINEIFEIKEDDENVEEEVTTESDIIGWPEEVPEVEESIDIEEIKKFNESLPFILPNKDKFRDTLLDETYYDLLRIYANELEKENTILISVGFSFADEHLLKITKRALRNPTFILFIICFDENEANKMKAEFENYQNVKCLFYKDHFFKFAKFTRQLGSIIDSKKDKE